MRLTGVLVRGWGRLGVTRKIVLACALLQGMILLVAATSYFALTEVRRAEQVILTSMEIRQRINAMEAGLEKARRLHRDFFLDYPRLGFDEAHARYVLPCTESIAQVVAWSAELRELIQGSYVSEALRRRNVDLNLYLSSARRFSDTFLESVDLVTLLAAPDSGLQDRLERLGRGLASVSGRSERTERQFLKMESLAKEYRITRQRPVMQAAFNAAFALRGAFADSAVLGLEDREEARQLIQEYVEVAERILDLDASIQGKFNDFVLQSRTVDPISEGLKALAASEVDQARRRILDASRSAAWIVVAMAVAGLGCSLIIVAVVNASVRRRFATLTRTAALWRAGDLSARMEGQGGDEFEALAETFNGMAGRLKDLVDNLEDKVVRRTAELNSALGELGRTVEELKSAKEAAEQAARVKADFLANMSHELRTPMNAILGFACLALGADPSPRQADCLTKIRSSAQSLVGIINDILDFSKMEAGKLEVERIPFQLDGVLDDVADVLGLRAAEKGIGFLFFWDPDLPVQGLGDPLRLRQTLVNLVGNAIKFTGRGEVSVTASVEGRREGATDVRFSVRDCGIGMDEAQMEKLFTSFSQADTSITRKYGGTGLGLAICRKLVTLMGGELRVRSTPGQGSEFSFTVPLGLAAEPEAPAPPGPADRAARVLVVEADERLARSLTEGLASLSLPVRRIEDADRALTALAEAARSAPFDVVFVGQAAGRAGERPDGQAGEPEEALDLIRRIRSHPRLVEAPGVVLLVPPGRAGLTDQLRQAGARAVLTGPFTRSSLRAAVRAALGLEESGGRRPGAPLPAAGEALAGVRGARVLLVEDNPLNRQIVVERLRQAGVATRTADNGRQGVHMALSEPFDLVFMDVQMPELDGCQAAALIRAEPRLAGLPIVAMTAHASDEDRDRCLRAGMNDHLAKPMDPDEIIRALIRWIAPARSEVPEPSAPASGGTGGHSLEDVALPDALPGLDMAEGLARVVGDRRAYLWLLKEFERQARLIADRLRQVLADEREVAKLAHALRGVAANIAAPEVRAAADALEQAAREGRGDELPALFAVLEQAADRVAQGLAALPRPRAAAGTAPPSAADPARIEAAADALAQLLQAQDLDAADQLDALALACQGRFADQLHRLEERLDALDFAAALVELDRIRAAAAGGSA